MAERSKAPDSRLNAFPAHNGSGRSGLRMEAWVRIPLLTLWHLQLFSLFYIFASADQKTVEIEHRYICFSSLGIFELQVTVAVR